MNNVIGPQHHTFNINDAQMTHIQELLDHITNDDIYQVGDLVTIIGNNAPSTFLVVKGLRPHMNDAVTEGNLPVPNDGDEDDNNGIVGIDLRRNNALTPIPTSPSHVIERGGAKRTRKGKHVKHRRTAKRRRNNTRRGRTARN